MRLAPRSWPWSVPNRRLPRPRPTSSGARFLAVRRKRSPTTSCALAQKPRGPTQNARPPRRAPSSGASDAWSLAQTTLSRVLGIDNGPVTVEFDRPAATRRRRRAEPRRRVSPPEHPLVQSSQAAVDVARAREEVLARDESAAHLSAVERLRPRKWCESRMGHSMVAPMAWVWSAPIGPRACRWSSPICSTLRACGARRAAAGRLDSRRKRPLRGSPPHCNEPAANRGSGARGGARHSAEHAGPTGCRTTKRGAGPRPL